MYRAIPRLWTNIEEYEAPNKYALLPQICVDDRFTNTGLLNDKGDAIYRYAEEIRFVRDYADKTDI